MATESPTGTSDVLIVYYSLTGNTARVARDLAKRTHAHVESLRDSDHGVGAWGYIKAMVDALRGSHARLGPMAYSPRNYRLVLIGTPVWAGRMTPAVRTYLRRYAGELRNVGFFITSGGTDVARLTPALEQAAGRAPIASAGFSASELADSAKYESKVDAFLSNLQLTADRQPIDSGYPLHAR